MADVATNNLADYIKAMSINISALSRESGVADGILRRSIVNKERSLRYDEALSICRFLRKDPFDFFPEGSRADAGQQAGQGSA